MRQDPSSWRGVFDVMDDALFFVRPIIRVNFRFTRKEGLYWRRFDKDERRLMSMDGLAVPYQYAGVAFFMTQSSRRRALDPLVHAWEIVDVPQGCWVDMTPIFTYKV